METGMQDGIELTIDGQRVLVTRKVLEALAEATGSQFKRAWLASNGYKVDDRTPLDYVNGVWATLSHIPEHAIATSKSARMKQIENNYRSSSLS
jgi:hypothetical protein